MTADQASARPVRRTPRTPVAAVCSVADQAVAAATNIVVLVTAARLSTVAQFSVFSLVYAVFTVLLGAFAAHVGQALVLERGSGAALAGHCRSALVFTAAASVLAGGLMAAVFAAVPGRTAPALVALGLVLPVVLTQDSLRYCFSALQLPQHALSGDLLRLAVTAPALAGQSGGSGAVRLLLVWGIAALPAVVLGAVLIAPSLRGATARPGRFLRRGHLGRRFVVEFAVGNASGQLAVVGLGLFADPLAVGALRGATTLFGPMNVLFGAATSFGPPLLNRIPAARRQVRATALLALALSAVAGCWAAVLLALPDRYGGELLGETWSASAALLPATGSQYAVMAAGSCALLTLRLLRPRATLPVQVVCSLLSVVFLLVGHALGGVLGAAWGLCLGSALKALVGWTRIALLPGTGPRR
ncbi:hypothetical protein [Streptomyces sp. TP-A0874]|uniref:hypothetical protein n=1 Tax=Streptomyces sp. TP-A0874 TaxID=549819 RepID=UPI000B2BE1C3|nr:hypothetical protein [Streptomyces sp. TP-A0874]